ncbi:MAG: type II toxin-antitoxin system HicB family antitoxin [Xenococcaceae cyanobacterium MO_167.B52]|nr:type II toxin-antitoxin system HicB family antitoxin [Xenococcaceae cyanobacterium MO_167.B52]
MNIRAIIEWDESAQAYSATCPELNFVSSFGDTKQEAISNLKNTII